MTLSIILVCHDGIQTRILVWRSHQDCLVFIHVHIKSEKQKKKKSDRGDCHSVVHFYTNEVFKNEYLISSDKY